MSRTVIAALMCLLCLVFPAAAHPRSAAELLDHPRITIRVYNYAGVAADQLRRAQQLTEHIFGKAGIDVTWIACPPADELRPNYPDCQKPPGKADVLLKILPHLMSQRLQLPPSQFGLAIMPGKGVPRVNAYILYDRILPFSSEHPEINPVVLLGCVAAHEIGHLMLGSNAHSMNGIMTAAWFGSNLRKAAAGALLFSNEQAQTMSQAIRRAEEHPQLYVAGVKSFE